MLLSVTHFFCPKNKSMHLLRDLFTNNTIYPVANLDGSCVWACLMNLCPAQTELTEHENGEDFTDTVTAFKNALHCKFFPIWAQFHLYGLMPKKQAIRAIYKEFSKCYASGETQDGRQTFVLQTLISSTTSGHCVLLQTRRDAQTNELEFALLDPRYYTCRVAKGLNGLSELFAELEIINVVVLHA